MALFKILRGESINLADVAVTDGFAYFTPENGKFYIDYGNSGDDAIFGRSSTDHPMKLGPNLEQLTPNRICINDNSLLTPVDDLIGSVTENIKITDSNVIIDGEYSRIEFPDLMEDLFRVAFTSLTRDMSYQLERSISRGKELSIKQAVRSDVLTENIKHAIATGNWVGGRAGVSQLLDRTSYMGTLSHLRRVVSPLTRSQPHFEARDLHPTQFGKICPNETPEGPNCGLVKNLALMCNISEGSDEQEIIDVIKKMNVLDD